MTSTASYARGAWMQTFTGRRFYPLDPRAEDVDPLDIAHALSLICRYGGHARRFYSVAEHCVHLSYEVPAEHALSALLHDAAEAYIGDMVRPLKQHMAPFRRVEGRVLHEIATRFGLYRLPDSVPEVVAADNRILLDERAAILTPTDDDWDVDHLEPLGVHIHGWDPVVAEHAFTERLHELWAPA